MISLEEIAKKQIIDFGHKCKVWLVSHEGTSYALKEVPKNDLNDMEVKHLFDEKQALQTLSHPNIIKLISTLKDDINLYFLLELARGAPLSYLIKQQRKFPLINVQSIVYQIAETLAYIHSQGFIYRDLKLSNVLLDTTGKITIVDLGLCTKIDDRKEYVVAGTTHAMAPEMIRHMLTGGAPCGYSYQIDWWALGILTYELLIGTPPFGLFGEDIIQNISQGIENVDMKDIAGVARDLITRLLCADPTIRLGSSSAQEVLQHAFMEIRTAIKPSDSLMNGINSWSEFTEETEEFLGPDPFSDF